MQPRIFGVEAGNGGPTESLPGDSLVLGAPVIEQSRRVNAELSKGGREPLVLGMSSSQKRVVIVKSQLMKSHAKLYFSSLRLIFHRKVVSVAQSFPASPVKHLESNYWRSSWFQERYQ